MSCFIALPVGAGDAFYLKREDFNVLVDGGRSESSISGLFKEHTQAKHLSVIVCTHNDADHANGVIGMLESWLTPIEEVWLPAKWTYRLEDLFKNQQKFYCELANDVERSKADSLECVLNEHFNDNYNENECSHENEYNLEEVIDFEDTDISYHKKRHFYPYPYTFYNFSKQWKLFIEAINAAERIKKIATLAYNNGCKIRFFENSNNPSDGKKGFLEPVNSKELFCVSSRKMYALEYLALSVANKNSLVFIAPENDKENAVLFCADSDLKFNLPQSPSRKPIITTPHHGSDAIANFL